MRAAPALLLLLLLLTPPASAAAQASCVAPEQAARFIGSISCVEGVITAVVFARQSTGQPTFLDFGSSFTAVIWSEDRPKFEPPPESWRGRRARVSGRLESYRGKAEIVLREASQLTAAGAPPVTPTVLRTAPSAGPSPATPPATVVVTATTPAVTAVVPAAAPVAAATATALASRRETVTAAIAPTPWPAQATAAPAAQPSETSGPPAVLLIAGVVLVGLGGGAGAWIALRGRAGRDL